MIRDLTANALVSRAQLSVVSPKNMSRADEPVFMRHVNFRGISPVFENARAADERCVVKVDDVEIAVIEHCAELSGVCDGTPGLLRQQWRK